MKKIFIAAGMLLIGASIAFAQTTTATKKEARNERKLENKTEVNDRTKDKFATEFPDAKDVKFVRGDQFDEAFFSKGNKKEIAYYDYNSHLVGTTQTKSFSDLPASGQKNILKDYKDYTVVKVIKFDDNENNDADMYLYGISFDDADNYFVELKNTNKAIVVKVDLSGGLSYFAAMH